jgi:hypothetical protein
MLLDIPLIADLITIRNSHQAIIDESLLVANLTGSITIIVVHAPDKLDARWTGPYDNVSVHVNGTLTIRLNAHTVECITIGHLDGQRTTSFARRR